MSEMPVDQEGQLLPEGNAESLEAVQPVEEIAEESTNSDNEPEKPRAKGVQKRIDELTANWREEQRTRQRLESMLEKVLTQKPAESKPVVQSEPKQDQFQTYEEFVDARAQWAADKRFEERLQQERERQEQADAVSKREAFVDRARTFAATTPDYDQVAFNPSLPISDTVADALNLSDKGPEILYFLGKNPSEAQRISSLTPVQAALEIGRLEAKLSLPQPRTVTKAPPPINPLSGGSGSVVTDPDKMTQGEWMKWREDQIRKRHG